MVVVACFESLITGERLYNRGQKFIEVRAVPSPGLAFVVAFELTGRFNPPHEDRREDSQRSQTAEVCRPVPPA